MKITLEPTEPAVGSIAHPTVTISIPDDDLTLGDAMEMVKQAMLGWGYPTKTVEDYWSDPQ